MVLHSGKITRVLCTWFDSMSRNNGGQLLFTRLCQKGQGIDMRTNFIFTITEFRNISYADVPSTKARLLAKGYKVDEIVVLHNNRNDKYTVSATHIE